MDHIADPYGMAEVHHLIALHGIEEARRQAVTKRERQAIETAYQVLSDDTDKIGFTYSGFALTSLPHRDPGGNEWQRDGFNISLQLHGGKERNGKSIGVPFGPCARLILLFLQTEAIRTKSREVELGRSMRMWMESMGLSIGGVTYKAVAEQVKRINACKITFIIDAGEQEIRRNSGFVRDSVTLSSRASDKQPSLWQDRVVLDETFYKALQEHPVPVADAALRAIGPRSLALDIYVWLAYRLHSLGGSTPIGWPALHAQFGFGYARIRKFREVFLDSLEIAMAAYPDAEVSLGKAGLVLHPSRPPIAKL